MIEINDKLVCNNNQPLSGNDVAPPLTVGEDYVAKDIHICGCGKQHIGVGLAVHVSYVTCHNCEEKMPLSTHWCHPSRFDIKN